jgi:hypothetical protein
MEEILVYILQEVVLGPVFFLIGFIWLYLRYRNKEKRRKHLDNEHNGSYRSAGILVTGQTFALIMIVLIFALIVGALYVVIAGLPFN